MDIKSITTILFSGASVCLGALLGVLRSKIFSSKIRTNLHYIFYAVSVILFVFSFVCLFSNWADFKRENWLSSVGEILAFVSSIALFFITKKYLIIKDTFNISELDPIINTFTTNADLSEIKLFGGDLNFFGNSASEMDNNIQYTHLRSRQFIKISILCEEPKDNTIKIRYGKILHDMSQVELRFYNPKEADLKVRGRITQVQGVSKLLMYTKIKSKVYQAIETDIANSNGLLYNNIWDLIWSLAYKPNDKQIDDYKKIFLGK